MSGNFYRQLALWAFTFEAVLSVYWIASGQWNVEHQNALIICMLAVSLTREK